MVNSNRANAIEISAEQGLNLLNKIKNAEIIKKRRYTSKQKELLNLFNDLVDVALTGKTLSSNDDNEKKKNEKENDKIIITKELNDDLDEIIDKSKSFEEQIKLLKKRKDLEGFYPYNDFGDKELKSKYFKIELADMSNEIDKKLFEQIFGHTLIKLADKLINTTNKEENQIIVKNIEKKININFLKWMNLMTG